MNLRKLIVAVFIICSGFVTKAQMTKPVEQCNDECCKDQKSTKKPSVKTKQFASMETVEKKKVVACKLTSPEMRKRKEQVLTLLKDKVLNRQDLKNGYRYKFEGTDAILDQVMEFIKSERACCDFFTFNLSIADDKSNIWLSITGPDGAKDFIKLEMDL